MRRLLREAEHKNSDGERPQYRYQPKRSGGAPDGKLTDPIAWWVLGSLKEEAEVGNRNTCYRANERNIFIALCGKKAKTHRGTGQRSHQQYTQQGAEDKST